jgi:hypothetical protein
MIRGSRGIYDSVRLFCLKGQFRNFKFENRGIFDSLCLKISRAWHVMGFSSILTGRGNGVAIFGVVGSLGGRNRSVGSLWGYTQNEW